MISLEQIRSLEERVHTAVTRIRTLTAENATLKQRLQSQEERIAEFETLVAAFKRDQDEIEAGILAALRHLDELEDTVSEPDFDAAAAPPADESTSHLSQPGESPADMPQPHEPQPDSADMHTEGSRLPGSESEFDSSWQATDSETPEEDTNAIGPGSRIDDRLADDRYAGQPGPEPSGSSPSEDSDTDEDPELDIF